MSGALCGVRACQTCKDACTAALLQAEELHRMLCCHEEGVRAVLLDFVDAAAGTTMPVCARMQWPAGLSKVMTWQQRSRSA